jgi:ABC-2 type transport system ATP-binding protein
MPEDRGLYKKMNIGEHAIYLARLKGMSKADAMASVKKWFVKFEMESWWNKKVEDLSKGMSQKLQFVTTILHNPSLIILDEPFSGLDPVNANIIKEEIFNLANNGATIIFSTHRMEQVEEICTQIVLINKGEKMLDGNIQDIKQDFKDNIFKIGANLRPEQLMTPIFEVIKHEKDSVQIKLSKETTNNELLNYFIQQQINIESFNEVLPSLNDIFIKLVENSTATRKFNITH